MALDFLNTEESVKLPVGGDFIPSGFIAQWFAGVYFCFYSKADLGPLMGSDECPKADVVCPVGQSGWRYYYKDQENAEKARKAAGEEIKSHQSWLWLAERETVLNIADADVLAKFNKIIAMELQVTTLKSKKYRHALHFIALPSAVVAMANILGFENPGFDLSELRADALYTDEFQFSLIGTDEDYTTGLLWKRRAALWNALGEPDPTKYQPKAAQGKFSTESEKLSQCLSILANPWKHPIWARLINVPSPVVDETWEKDDKVKRNTIPCLYEIFPTEQAARATAEKENKERAERKAKETNNGNGAKAPARKNEKPMFPKGVNEKEWRDWTAMLKDLIAKSKTEPKAWLAANGEQLGGYSVDEILPWVV